MDQPGIDPAELAAYKENKLREIENSLQFEFQQAKGVFINKLQKIGPIHGSGNKFLSNYRLHQAERLADNLGRRLKISPEIVAEAKRMYQYVQSKNWVQGRSTTLVILACLYFFCRKHETGHLMIDFADETKVNVFGLSKMYLKLTRDMNLSVRLTDPSMYVPRFLKALNFDKGIERAILDYVLRLLARMRKDWLGQGRRPSGLIASSFWIASKCFGVKKSIKEISGALKVSEETIRKRVNEFKGLKVACLTREEFQNLEHLNYTIAPADPPAFTKARAQSVCNTDMRALLTGPWNEADGQRPDFGESVGSLPSVAGSREARAVYETVHPLMRRENQEAFFKKSIEEENHLTLQQQMSRRASACFPGIPPSVDQSLSDPKPAPVTPENKNPRVVEASPEGMQVSLLRPVAVPEVTQPPPDFDDSIIRPEEFSDTEIDRLMYTPMEVKFKTAAWNKLNRGWIEEQKVKAARQKDAKSNLKKIRKEHREKTKVLFTGSQNPVVNSIKNSKIGRRINTDALEKLFEKARAFGKGDSQ